MRLKKKESEEVSSNENKKEIFPFKSNYPIIDSHSQPRTCILRENLRVFGGGCLIKTHPVKDHSKLKWDK